MRISFQILIVFAVVACLAGVASLIGEVGVARDDTLLVIDHSGSVVGTEGEPVAVDIDPFTEVLAVEPGTYVKMDKNGFVLCSEEGMSNAIRYIDLCGGPLYIGGACCVTDGGEFQCK